MRTLAALVTLFALGGCDPGAVPVNPVDPVDPVDPADGLDGVELAPDAAEPEPEPEPSSDAADPGGRADGSDPDSEADSDAGSEAEADSGPDSGPDAPADVGPEALPPPPAELGLDVFYAKYVDAGGIPVVGSALVPDEALLHAAEIVVRMLEARPDVVAEMVSNQARLAVMAQSEVTTDVPEHSDLYELWPNQDWDAYRGIGGTLAKPVTSCAEENVLCYPSDIYAGESILVHELAHGIYNLGLAPLDPAFDAAVNAAYLDALAAGLWASTYAGSHVAEYWAEGVQSFYDTNAEAIPTNGIHNHVDTREELFAYDPVLYALVAEVHGEGDWRPACP